MVLKYKKNIKNYKLCSEVIFKEDLTNLFTTFKNKEGDFKNGVLSRLNKLEEYFSKNDRRLLTVERETSVQKNDLASHKLLKERQFENLEEKTCV